MGHEKTTKIAVILRAKVSTQPNEEKDKSIVFIVRK